jgi:hypothetical protein
MKIMSEPLADWRVECAKPLMPGVYKHYKGGRYLLICEAETHEHNGDIDVVYLSLEYGAYRTRPRRRDLRNQDSWDDVVMWPDGVERLRFMRLAEGVRGSDSFQKVFDDKRW